MVRNCFIRLVLEVIQDFSYISFYMICNCIWTVTVTEMFILWKLSEQLHLRGIMLQLQQNMEVP